MNGQYLCNRPITISFAFKKRLQRRTSRFRSRTLLSRTESTSTSRKTASALRRCTANTSTEHGSRSITNASNSDDEQYANDAWTNGTTARSDDAWPNVSWSTNELWTNAIWYAWYAGNARSTTGHATIWNGLCTDGCTTNGNTRYARSTGHALSKHESFSNETSTTTASTSSSTTAIVRCSYGQYACSTSSTASSTTATSSYVLLNNKSTHHFFVYNNSSYFKRNLINLTLFQA